MPKMNIQRSIDINAPMDKVYTSVSDFNHWTAWSPWLIMEPEAEVKVSDDAKSYSWEGKRVGSGNMEITKADEGKSVDYNLVFLKPWKSKAKVRFELKENGDNTQVTWYMESGLPIFMFWMKKMMEAFVGMDYERGLMMLKDYVEDGEVHSKLEFKGSSNFSGCKYIGIKTTCTKGSMPDKMKADFEKIGAYAQENQDNVAGVPFSIYHKWDMVKDDIEYTSGIPVKSIPSPLPGGMISGEIPQTLVYSLGHTGPYAHLGNAWSTLYNLQRSKVFKSNKKIHPFETYVSNPMETGQNELVTEVHFPIK